MEVKELKDSWTGVTTLIEDLEKLGSLFIIRNKDGSPKMVYYNENPTTIMISNGICRINY
jgi:transcription initiation factor TFIIE subunit beta